MITLKPFQENAINELKKEFLHKWLKNRESQEIVFKSPTGSGKTVMMAQFLRDITSDPRIGETKRAYIWFAPKGLEAQSKEKLFKYYDGASELNLVDKSHIQSGSMNNNDVLFINWEILRAKNADTRKLRGVSGETGYTFDEYMTNTHEKNIQMIVIIDEDHIGGASVLSKDIIEAIHPRVIMRVSATPTQTVDVEVPHEAVIEAGLIKEKVIFQTSEDLEKIIKKETDRDHALIDLAYNKRLELKGFYEDLGIDINPLVLIQLPNDDKKSKEVDSHTKKEIVLEYLKEKGVLSEHIAIWLTGKEKENLLGIENSNNPIQFLLFKQAAATGWDCPRAGVLVMFRETDGGNFGIQTVGRILRMPEAKYYPVTALNRGYLYTNYERNKILAEIRKSNDPSLNLSNISSSRKDSVPVYELPTVLMSRSDYNDLGDSFQKTFFKVAEDKLGITNTLKASKTLSGRGFNAESAYVESSWITGIELDNYDNFRSEALDEGVAHSMNMSEHDIERLYNLLCFDFIAKQTDEVKKFAPERSWGKVKTALNVFFSTYTQLPRNQIYALIVRDMVSVDGILRSILEESLKQYRPIRNNEVGEREIRKKRTENLLVPAPVIYFPGNYIENTTYKKCATEICYLSENMPKNEKDFIEFMESHKSIKYWLKNGDSGSDSLAIDYHSVINNKEALFYPDWFIWTDKGLCVVDTKEGITASDLDTTQKANALQKWLLDQNKVKGGIVVPDGENGWKINTNEEYEYNSNLKGWKNLNHVLK